MGLHAKTPHCRPEWRALGRSWHGHTPAPAAHPAPQTTPVSNLHRQPVHVNRKIDVLDRFSHFFWASFSTTRSAPHARIDVESHDQKCQKESNSVAQNILTQWRGVQYRGSVWSDRSELGFGHLKPYVSSTYFPGVRNRYFGFGSSVEGQQKNV